MTKGCDLRLFSFDLQAKNYIFSSKAQRFFAQQLAQKILQKWGKNFLSVLDLGCGAGALPQAMQQEGILIKTYRGCDISQAMLDCFDHSYAHSMLFCQDFDQCLIQNFQPELIVSSSALQWSLDLRHTLSLIAKQQSKIALSLISSNTFKELHTFLGTKSPLMSIENMQELLLNFFDGQIEIAHQDFIFNDSNELISHLRNSGVMGGGIAGYKKAKQLLNYTGKLQYESLIFLGNSKP